MKRMCKQKIVNLLYVIVLAISLSYVFLNKAFLPEVTTAFLIPFIALMCFLCRRIQLNFDLNFNFEYNIKMLMDACARLLFLYFVVFYTIQYIYLDKMIGGKTPFDWYSQKAIWVWEINIFSLEVSAYMAPIILVFNLLIWYAIRQISILLVSMFVHLRAFCLRTYSVFDIAKIALAFLLNMIDTAFVRSFKYFLISTAFFKCWLKRKIIHDRLQQVPPALISLI